MAGTGDADALLPQTTAGTGDADALLPQTTAGTGEAGAASQLRDALLFRSEL